MVPKELLDRRDALQREVDDLTRRAVDAEHQRAYRAAQLEECCSAIATLERAPAHIEEPVRRRRNLRKMVLDHVVAHDGVTPDATSAALGIRRRDVDGAVVFLIDKGKIHETGGVLFSGQIIAGHGDRVTLSAHEHRGSEAA